MSVGVSMQIAETILKFLQQPVLVLDEALRPVMANPAFRQVFELAEADFGGTTLHELFLGQAFQPRLETVLEPVILAGMDVEGVEMVGTLATGRGVHLLVSARRLRIEGLPWMVLVELHDITGEIQTELRIQELNDALRAHVTTVDAMNEELESYSHSVSHDLRTPLRFVNRIAHLLLHGPGAQLSDLAQQQVNMILQATGEMGNLIERLLVFSQVGRAPMRSRQVDLGKLFQRAMEELSAVRQGRSVEIEIGELPPCRGDQVLLKEVVINLLENALKFTQQRNPGRVAVGCAEMDGQPTYFVQDNGVGFDMRDYDALFLPFQRLHKVGDFEGMGIGLALVKRIIERHGGRIWASAKVDQGATFYFTLGQGRAA